ncbi:bromodomain adjacent to zinc finger domain protein 2A isoform X3 [Monodelphis domestica]|uniref:bromodomain adjacent to zinc finger domain protein 2A isoform X3 n=1 Tax=Monodelphis domestica TaxID=13616 RepID=UPI0024E1E739|nr:bromodomain adjacent to zinc finger domain protein 2A isoform X3 [Monodelphis domestica]
MEANDHFNFTGLPSAPAASGLKPSPSSGEGLYTNGSPMNFSQQGKSLNGDVNVNGLSTVSHTTSGILNSSPHSSDTSHLHHPNVAYDCLWNYSQYSAAGPGANLKEPPLLSQFSGHRQYPLNGTVEGGQPGSPPSQNTTLRAGSQEFWANGTQSPMGLNFDSQELYDSFPDQNFEVMSNGPPSFFTSSPPSPMLGSGIQTFAPSQEPERGEEATKELAPGVAENGTGLVGSLELEGEQPELKICDYDDSAPSVDSLHQEVSVLVPDPTVSCLDDPSQLPEQLEDSPILEEDPLEPFGSLAPEPGSGGLYGMDDSELVSEEDKLPLGVSPDISALDCPSLNNSTAFSLLADDSQTSASIFANPPSPPVLGESVLQDGSFELNNGSDPEQEEGEPSLSAASPPDLEREAPAQLSPEDTDTDGSPGGTPDLEDKTVGGASASGNGDVLRRRVATPEEVRFPLQHGWRREVRIKKGSHRWQGETWYYGPCGKRMKQFPEVIKYLSRNVVHQVRREHFSFSPRMPVGDFYEERDTPEGLKWVQLSVEEIPSRIQAITGKRGRPRNTEKAKAKEVTKVKRGRGRPPKVKITELLSKADARLLKRLEVPDTLSDGEKAKMRKIKKKIRRKAKTQRKQEAKSSKQKEVKKKPKAEKEKTKAKAEKVKEKGRKEKARRKDKEEVRPVCKAERVAAPQRRLEERQRQMMILEEMKKPTEDMCLADHQPLPDFSRIPGLRLPSATFSHCLTIVEFLHSFGKVLGLDPARDVPSLGTLQEGLLGRGEASAEVQDLLVRLLGAALRDPGLPAYCQSLKILGEKVSEIPLTGDNVSEILRCFLMAYGAEPAVCDSLRTQPFQAQLPQHKASVLAFLVHELNGSGSIVEEIDKTLESMSSYRRNKWVVEGRLRRLKTALAKRTGRPEADLLGSEESVGRRRSSRILEEMSGLEEEEEEEEEGDPPAFSVPELERQIEKLTKRQLFFRKKLLHSSQMLRAVSLGQDRYRRRYWVLPYLSGIFVEGAEEGAALEDETKQDADPAEGEAALAPATPPLVVKKESAQGAGRPWSPCARTRGRPRKTKPVPEPPGSPLSPMAKEEPEPTQAQEPRAPELAFNGLLEPEDSPMSLGQSQHDLSQSAFLSWLSQTQRHGSVLSSSVLTPDSSPGQLEPGPPAYPEEPEPPGPRGPWFNLLPRTPCDEAVHKDGPGPDPPPVPVNGSSATKPHSPKAPPSASASRRWAGGPGKGPQSPGGSGQPKRRGRPPSKFFKQMEQRYLTQLTAQPVPADMLTGWWWIRDPEELEATLRALHPRGIREKALHKHLCKHRDFLRDVCLRPSTDSILQPSRLPMWSPKELAGWAPAQRTFEADLAMLRRVEELEQRVLLADLQIRGWTCPSPDSAREDLAYCEHRPEPLEDIMARGRGRDGLAPPREDTNPLDLAVLRLAALEQNVERRYLREPLWPAHEVVLEKALLSSPDSAALGTTEIAYEITPRIRTWRQTLERCRSAAQVCLCLGQLERSIAWEKSVNKVTCLVCRRGDNDEFLLLCDGCDRGCHIYCHRPRMDSVPEGDWFCAICTAQQTEGGCPKRGQKRKGGPPDPTESESKRRRRAVSRGRDGGAPGPRCSGDGLASRRRLSVRHHRSDLTFCEIILMEMESHASAWPFLEPVNPRLVSGYRRIIKNPMDFSTMRERLLRGGYANSEEFAADALLVFDNCQTFNEDDSEVGKAGHVMRRFFESRWEEFYQGKRADL